MQRTCTYKLLWLLFVVCRFMLDAAQVVNVQSAGGLSSRGGLSSAIRDRARVLLLQSNITGVPGESVVEPGVLVENRYDSFPEAPKECLTNAEPCLQDPQYIQIPYGTNITIKGGYNEGRSRYMWDMGLLRRRILVSGNIIMENVTLRGFAEEANPNLFFFMFHNAAGATLPSGNLVCRNCTVEHSCGGGKVERMLEGLLRWGTLSGDTAPEISEDGMSAIVSATLSMSLEVTEGSTSTQEFLDGTIRCNHDLLATDLEPEAPREEDTCQSADIHTYRGTANTTVSGKDCQEWEAQEPHAHTRIPGAYPFSGLVGNYCRNPDNAKGVWCYTMDPDTEWEHCGVPFCSPGVSPPAPGEPPSTDTPDTSTRGGMSRTSQQRILAGSVASACVLLVLIALAVWCCCARQKRQKKLVHSQKALQKPGVEGGGVDGAPPPAAVKAASVGDQNQTSLRAAAVSGDGEDGCSMGPPAASLTPLKALKASSLHGSSVQSQPTSSTAQTNHSTQGTHAITGTSNGFTDPTMTSLNMERPPESASLREKHAFLEHQLDGLRGQEVLSRFTVLDGFSSRRRGGQAVVQVVEDRRKRIEYAIKFYLFRDAFEGERALYQDLSQPLGQFLPEVQCIVDSGERGFTDARGGDLPPCIVMEKGESLDVWAASTGDGLDMVTGLQVLTHVADRVQALHAAGYVHRDIKPGNVLWLPRKKRWTLIDFGCVARTGVRAGIGFTLNFAAPEVIAAHRAQQQRGAAQHDGIIATEAIDAWSMGILAIEVFTGKPAFGIFHDKQMREEMILGETQAPWEQPATAATLARRFGHLQDAIFALLDRDPAKRPCMAALQRACRRVLSNTTVTAPLEDQTPAVVHSLTTPPSMTLDQQPSSSMHSDERERTSADARVHPEVQKQGACTMSDSSEFGMLALPPDKESQG